MLLTTKLNRGSLNFVLDQYVKTGMDEFNDDKLHKLQQTSEVFPLKTDPLWFAFYLCMQWKTRKCQIKF